MNTSATSEEAPPKDLISLQGLLDRYWDPGFQPHPVTIRSLCRNGMPHIRCGRRYFFVPELVDAWFAERTFPTK